MEQLIEVEDLANLVHRQAAARQNSARIFHEQGIQIRQQAAGEQAQRAYMIDEQETHSQELNALLESDTTAVVQALLRSRVPQDAKLGRMLPKSIGWFLALKTVPKSNNQDFYQNRSWLEAAGTVLCADGTIAETKPVVVRSKDFPVASDESIGRVVRRSSGIARVSVETEQELQRLRRRLAVFVVDKGLEL